MKSEDFEKLKEICAKEGFELLLDAIEGYNQEHVFRVHKKHPKVRIKSCYMDLSELYIKFYLENAQHLHPLLNSDKIAEYLRRQLENYLNEKNNYTT